MYRTLGVIHAFLGGLLSTSDCRVQKSQREERDIRNNLPDRRIDRMVEDSFPASDPPATY